MTSQTSGITSERPPRPQAHGGVLLTGPSNRGGPGRTPKHVKNLALEIAANGTRRLKELIEEGTFEGKPVSASAWAQAWKMAADVGIDKVQVQVKLTVEATTVLTLVAQVLADSLPTEQAQALMSAIGELIESQTPASQVQNT